MPHFEWRDCNVGLVTAPILFGVEALAAEPMVVNGQLVPASVQLVGNDGNAVAKTIADRVTGKTLVEGGSGTSPTFGVSGPGRPGECLGIKGAGAGQKYLQAPDNDLGDVSTEHLVLELVWKHGTVANGGMVAKWSGNNGFGLYWQASNQIRLLIKDGTNQAVLTDTVTATEAIVHAIYFINKSGSALGYFNAAAGTPVACSSVGSLTVASPLMMHNFSGGAVGDNTVFYFGLHKKAGWLASHLNPTVAKARFSIFCHYLAAHNHASLVPTLPTRTSAAYSRGF